MSNFIELISVTGYEVDMSVGNPPNAHQGYQLFYNLSGKAVYMVSDRKYTLTEGEYIIVPPFAVHSLVTDLDTKLVVLDIQFSVVDGSFDKKVRGLCASVHQEDSFTRALMRGIMLEARRRNGYFHHSVRNLLESFLLRLLDLEQGEPAVTENSLEVDFAQLSWGTKRTIRYLDGMVCGNHKFDLDYIARVLGYSKRYVCQTFFDEVGMTVKQYLMMMRIEKAKELIDYTDYSIKDISVLLNFNSFTYFERAFKQYTGLTPLAYRKRSDPRKCYLSYSFRDDVFGDL